jgi:glycosyltransferase involved in cell wall biosynthesis
MSEAQPFNPLRFHVYAINWNEERLLPLFFRHYRQADKIVILDNESTDRSLEICKAHGAEVISFSTGQKLDDHVNRTLKNTAWHESRGKADYVIVQDLDEFVYFPKYPNNLRAGLEELRAKGVTLART